MWIDDLVSIVRSITYSILVAMQFAVERLEKTEQSSKTQQGHLKGTIKMIPNPP
jgi:hypothetical protein